MSDADTTAAEHRPRRWHYLQAPNYRLLYQACANIIPAFGVPYLVGSSTKRPDWRDVDLRVIQDDDEYRALFNANPAAPNPEHNMRWSIICSLVSLHLSKVSELPVDFQIQSQTQANAYEGPRNPMGLYPRKFDDEGTTP